MIHVNYPVYAEHEVPGHIFDNNLILVDACGSNGYVKRFSELLPIMCDENGFEYNGVRREGDYVVMQIVPNPYYNNYSMLVINTNCEEKLAKNLFTRKIIIPFYFNGRHPYFNNEGLIFIGSRYYAIYEWGMDMEEVQ